MKLPLSDIIETHGNNPMTTDDNTNDIRAKATGYIKDGLFDHHVSFYYVEDGYFFYKEYFGNGWNKRKIDENGFAKYLNSLMFNVNSRAIYSRSSYERGVYDLIMYC